MEPLGAFEYQLLEDPGSIRLLVSVSEDHLLIVEPLFQIEMQLQHAVLSPSLTYEALSYTWGLSVETKLILLNGKPFTVRENLYSFLKRRGNRAEILFWVDAICINQQDLDERNSQVKTMGEIFAQASKVLIWLGHLGIDPSVFEDTTFPTKELHRGWYKDEYHRHDTVIEAARRIYGTEYCRWNHEVVTPGGLVWPDDDSDQYWS